MSDTVRVRFAPSPTGPLHMGGVRTALYNYLFAKKNGGQFILRLEDTDQTRFVEGAEKYIIESLKWCGIEPDEGVGYGGEKGPYRQSERKEMYKPYAEQLIGNGSAYYAFDTPEELNEMREKMKSAGVPSPQYNQITRSSMKNSLTLPAEEVNQRMKNGDPYVIRMKMPRNEEVKFFDEIRGWVVVNTNNLDDKVLFKSDGMPTYHLANIVDDHLMDITHVIRGEEWLPSLPLHILLYRAFEWNAPKFAHLPLILRPDGKGKLSKRDGDKLGFPVYPIDWKNTDGEVYSGYREKGYFASSFINMLAFLGWNPGTEQEIFSLEQLVDSFSLERVNKAGARFDPDKTRWFNQQYLKNTPNKILADQLVTQVREASKHHDLEKVCSLMKERATFIPDIYKEGIYLFEEPNEYDEKTIKKKWKEDSGEILSAWIDELEKINNFTADEIEKSFKAYLEQIEKGFGAVLPLFRVSITGTGMGPSMFEICELLGKDEIQKRMSKALEVLPKIKAAE